MHINLDVATICTHRHLRFRRLILCILVSLLQHLQKCTSTSFAIYLSVNLCISFLHHCDIMMFLQEDGRSCTNICSLPELFMQRLKHFDNSRSIRELWIKRRTFCPYLQADVASVSTWKRAAWKFWKPVRLSGRF